MFGTESLKLETWTFVTRNFAWLKRCPSRLRYVPETKRGLICGLVPPQKWPPRAKQAASQTRECTVCLMQRFVSTVSVRTFSVLLYYRHMEGCNRNLNGESSGLRKRSWYVNYRMACRCTGPFSTSRLVRGWPHSALFRHNVSFSSPPWVARLHTHRLQHT